MRLRRINAREIRKCCINRPLASPISSPESRERNREHNHPRPQPSPRTDYHSLINSSRQSIKTRSPLSSLSVSVRFRLRLAASVWFRLLPRGFECHVVVQNGGVRFTGNPFIFHLIPHHLLSSNLYQTPTWFTLPQNHVDKE
jgi:hypothetical protein